MEKIKFPYYKPPVTEWRPIEGWVTIEQFLQATKEPKPPIIDAIAAIRHAASIGDKKTKGQLKQEHLYFFLPNVQMNGNSRGHKDITQFNPILGLDFDGMSPAHRDYFKHELFEAYSSIIALWDSTSLGGFRGLVSIPKPKTVAEFKSYYFGFAADLEEKFPALAMYLDPQLENPTQAAFQSYDKHLLIREWDDVEPWTVVGYKDGSVNIGGTNKLTSTTDWDWKKQEIYAKIYQGFAGIPREQGGGHGGLRAVAFTIGGYVGAGRISEDEAIKLFDSLIQSHPYLSSKPSVYMQTARDMFKKGKLKPWDTKKA